MFGVVQFEKKECAVVPLVWLIDDQTKCLWPRQINQKTLDQFVIAKREPLATWIKYPIVKLHHINATYDEACKQLEKVIEENNSSDASEANFNETLFRKKIESYSEFTKKRKLTKTEIDKRQRRDTSSEEFSSEEGGTKVDFPNESSFDTTVTLESSTRTTLPTPSLSTSAHSTPVPAPSGPACSSSSTPLLSHAQGLDNALAETILERLERVIALQDQNSIKLDNILRHQQQAATHLLERPPDFPILPVKNKAQYRALEEFLSTEEKFTYMKRRLASIGGSSVRNTVMNILKYLLSNQVAMKFNWCGKDKKPFKKTRMCAVITEAIKFCYVSNNGSDSVSDKIIKESIQDWLKLAKSRYEYSLKKQND